jgi:SWI/SNF-related matrix-associated actin-dependent regulator of chromatin subfamily A3
MSRFACTLPFGPNTQQYDSNAIRVDNVLGRQIGHIPRAVAEKLAPYLVGANIDRT